MHALYAITLLICSEIALYYYFADKYSKSKKVKFRNLGHANHILKMRLWVLTTSIFQHWKLCDTLCGHHYPFHGKVVTLCAWFM